MIYSGVKSPDTSGFIQMPESLRILVKICRPDKSWKRPRQSRENGI